MDDLLPTDWRRELADELAAPWWGELCAFVAAERRHHQVFPPRQQTFSAFARCGYEQVRAVIIGQDPYHDDGQAHGLAFSVPPGTAPPPSLRNILRERQDDLGLSPPADGSLIPWARRGVLMINAVLTVRAHCPGSHQDHGWERFTAAVLRALSRHPQPLVFLLWGGRAQAHRPLLDAQRHRILPAPHPSPLSAWRGFFGSRPFSKTNRALEELGRKPLDWSLPGDDQLSLPGFG